MKLTDISRIKESEKLQRLSFAGCDELTDLNAISELDNLKRLGLPNSISSEDFEELIEKQTKLEILELAGSEEITDLKVLETIPKLSCLNITEMDVDPESLFELNKLNFLAFPGDVFEDSVMFAQLSEELPQTFIVPTSAFCLGSAWLLLLFPAFLFVYLIKSRSRRKV